MANKPFKRRKITVGVGGSGNPASLTFWFLAPKDTYDGTVLAAAASGVEEIADSVAESNVDKFAPLCTVESLLRSNLVVRRKIALRGTDNVTRYKQIIIAKDKANAFAPTGTIDGKTIVGVVTPLSATFS
jgi:hypothetical protein